MTNLPKAVEVLANYYDDSNLVEVVHEALVRMGDLAVSKLESIAEGDSENAMNALVKIGTPHAVAALERLNDNQDPLISTKAAFYLAADNSSKVLDRYRGIVAMPKPDEEFKVIDWDWLSKHFEPSKAKRMAKVAWSITRSTSETIPQHSLTLDPFIVIPLCAIALRDDINISILRDNKRLRSAADRAKNTTELKQQAQLIEKVLSAIKPSPRWQYLFDSLTPDLQFDLLYRLINYRLPSKDDWLNVFLEVKCFRKIKSSARR